MGSRQDARHHSVRRCQKVVVNHDIPFHFIRVTRENKPEAEAQLLAVVEDSGADLIVLARYMQSKRPVMLAVTHKCLLP